MTSHKRSLSSISPSIIVCAGTLVAVRLALKIRGFGWTIEAVRRRTSALSRAQRASLAELEEVASAVAAAAAVFPGRALCLEQSISLFFILRRRGIDVQFRVGVQPYGFVAHAWVESKGVPIFEPGEMVRNIIALPDFMS
jgi:hypothetical protein